MNKCPSPTKNQNFPHTIFQSPLQLGDGHVAQGSYSWFRIRSPGIPDLSMVTVVPTALLLWDCPAVLPTLQPLIISAYFLSLDLARYPSYTYVSFFSSCINQSLFLLFANRYPKTSIFHLFKHLKYWKMIQDSREDLESIPSRIS